MAELEGSLMEEIVGLDPIRIKEGLPTTLKVMLEHSSGSKKYSVKLQFEDTSHLITPFSSPDFNKAHDAYLSEFNRLSTGDYSAIRDYLVK